MGFTSQTGQVGFGIQSGKGVVVASPGRFARLRGGALAPNRSLLIPDAEIGGNRDIPQAYLGPVSYSGSYDFYARMEIIALLLRMALGTNADGSSTAGTAEVQTVTINGAPTGGTFTLTFRGQTTSALAYNAAAAAVQTALQALSTIGASNATVTGSAGGPYTVTFAGSLNTGNQKAITAISSLTGGTNPSVTVAETTPGGAVMATHTITPIDGSLPWVTIEERIGLTYEAFKYTDAKCDKLHLECDASNYMMGTAEFTALSQAAGITPTASPAIDTSPMIVGTQVLLYWNGVQLPAQKFNIDITNNMDTGDFRLGSLYLGDLVEKRRELTLGCTILPQDSTLWRQAVYGGTALTAPRGGAAALGTLTMIANTYEYVQGTTPYSLRIDVPSAAIQPFAISPANDNVITHDITFQLLRDDPTIPIATFTVTNDLATNTA